MDLKIKDVTELLNVSESTIKRWVAEGKIPYYKLHNQYRFSTDEIENWMFSCKQEGGFAPFDHLSSKEKLGTQQFGLFRAIHKGGVFLDINGKDKEEVIQNAMEKIGQELGLDGEMITQLLLDRERLMSTALGKGVAVPHTRDFLLQEAFDVIAVAHLNEPIEYGALDNKPVHTLFFLFACDDRRHLNLLAKLAHLCSDEEHMSFLRQKPEKQQLLDYIKQWETKVHKPELASV